VIHRPRAVLPRTPYNEAKYPALEGGSLPPDTLPFVTDERPRLRHVPRVHAAWIAERDPDREHAAAPTSGSLCGVAEGQVVRHLFEDVSRAKTCPRCQALSDSVRAADLLGAVAGAAARDEISLGPDVTEAASHVEEALLAIYPQDATAPDYDVRHP